MKILITAYIPKYMTVIVLPVLVMSMTGCVPQMKNHQPASSNTLDRLKAGNTRFVRHQMRHPDQSAARIAETAAGQKPYAVVITCSDSRVAPEIIFDEGIGDLFVIRNAGNIVEEEDALASVEYAVAHLGVRTVVIMGHEHCGAIEAMTHETSGKEPEHIAAIIERLKSEPEEQKALAGPEKGEQLVHQCVLANVEHGAAVLRHTMEHLETHGVEMDVAIIRALYDVQTGEVRFLDLPSPEK